MKRFFGILGMVFLVLSGINTLVEGYGYLFPESDQHVLWSHAEGPMAYRSARFALSTTVDGVDAGNEDLTQTVLTLWRDGGVPITAAMTRRPIRIDLPSGSRLVAWKILDTESSVPDNFKVEREGDALLLTWTVFDPDMAIRLALVRAGSSDKVAVTDEIGPGVRTWTHQFTVAKVIWVVTAALIAGLAALAVIIVLFGLFMGGTFKLEKHVPYRVVRWPVVALGFVVLMVLIFQANAFWGRTVDWVANALVKPIPFQ